MRITQRLPALGVDRAKPPGPSAESGSAHDSRAESAATRSKPASLTNSPLGRIKSARAPAPQIPVHGVEVFEQPL
jgi:hypothetical protein